MTLKIFTSKNKVRKSIEVVSFAEAWALIELYRKYGDKSMVVITKDLSETVGDVQYAPNGRRLSRNEQKTLNKIYE